MKEYYMDPGSEPKIMKLDIAANLNKLFELDSKVAAAAPAILPLETPQELLDFLTKEHDSEVYVCENENRDWAGYVALVDLSDSELEVLNIGIDPAFQGQGWGAKLMKFSEDVARRAGKTKVSLITSLDNHGAQNFYTRLGYANMGESSHTYSDGKPRIAFEKTLGMSGSKT